MEENISSCRNLIGAILEQAFYDAQSTARECEPLGAQRFIDPNNKLFVHYCNLIDLDPEYVAEKMWVKIKKNLQKKKEREERMRNVVYRL